MFSSITAMDTAAFSNLPDERPMLFSKYHALGNDYLVVWNEDDPPSDEQVKLMCDRRYGIGGDGVLLGPLASNVADFRLRILNPDGSEAEKSGNGLRIFSRFLWDTALVGDEPFTIETGGGVTTAQVFEGGQRVRIAMGRVSFHSSAIPVAGAAREVLSEPIAVGDATFFFSGATLSNPHCVIQVEAPTEDMARRYGPLIETHPLFPRRTNVQFMRVIDRDNIQIEIWERGVGYTHASGSSSCAAAAVAHRLGLCDERINVHMRGGALEIVLDSSNVVMSGPVTRICTGELSDEVFDREAATHA